MKRLYCGIVQRDSDKAFTDFVVFAKDINEAKQFGNNLYREFKVISLFSLSIWELILEYISSKRFRLYSADYTDVKRVAPAKWERPL